MNSLIWNTMLTRSEISQDSLSIKYWIAFRCSNDWFTCLCRGGSSTSRVVILNRILLWISASLSNSLCTTLLTVKARLSILLELIGSDSWRATVFSWSAKELRSLLVMGMAICNLCAVRLVLVREDNTWNIVSEFVLFVVISGRFIIAIYL